MRIAEINDVAYVASELATGLRARGHEVTVIQPRLFGSNLAGTVKPVVGPIRAAEWLQIIREVHAGRYDVVHIHYAYLGMVGVLGRFPYVLHCHGSDVRETTTGTRPMVNAALDHASHVFYATPDLARCVLPRRPDAEFCPNPVDTAIFRPEAPARESRDVYIACSLTAIKGAIRIYRACKRLARSRPDIRFTAIAGGEYTSAFRELPNVTLLPSQPRTNLPRIIDRHGVVVGQMLLGAAGMAELEAMACARPVVSWFAYGRAYPEPPPLVRVVDGVEIAAEIGRLVDDADLRERLGEESRRWIERYHQLDAITARVEAVLTDVADGRVARPSQAGAAS